MSLHALEILFPSYKAGREPHFILAQGWVERTSESAVALGVRALLPPESSASENR